MSFTILNTPQNFGVNNNNTDKSLKPKFGERTAFSITISRRTSREPCRLTQQSPPSIELADGFKKINDITVNNYTQTLTDSSTTAKKNKTSGNWVEMQVFK
jgi:hypothetical protein